MIGRREKKTPKHLLQLMQMPLRIACGEIFEMGRSCVHYLYQFCFETNHR